MRDRFLTFFGIDDPWRRPLPAGWWRHDLIIAAAFFLLSALGLEVSRSAYQLTSVHHPVWLQYVPLVAGAVTLVWRRRLPLIVMLLTGANMFITGVTMPPVMLGVVVQLLYLFGFYSSVAWGHPRRRTLVASVLLVLFMFGWIAVQFRGSGLGMDRLHALAERGSTGLFGVVTANVIGGYLANSFYFFGAIGFGALSWRNARQNASLVDRNDTIAQQSAQLKDKAVVDERLRIARELHDVVAHHVSVIGVQAGAARRVLAKDTGRAEQSLATIEASSRSAVDEMRGLLGTLRAAGPEDRAPEPGIGDISDLVGQFRSTGLPVDLEVVDSDPALVDHVPAAIGLSIYRTTQEALANVRKHSTAAQASVRIRLGHEDDRAYAETEVLDAGRPRTGTRGGGLGLVGMRERVTVHGGTAEIGPRTTGGYRVRVRLPFPEPDAERSEA